MNDPRALDYDGLDGVISTPARGKNSKALWMVLFLILLVLVLFSAYDRPSSPVQQVEVLPDKPLDQSGIESSSTTNHATDVANIQDHGISHKAPNPKGSDDALIVFPTEPTSAGYSETSVNIVPFSIYFKFNEITPKFTDVEANKLLVMTKRCKKGILITGHTCNLGDDHVNYQIGKARAESIKKWLVNHGGIPSEHIKIKSKGQSKPIMSNGTKSGRALNRRAELTCLDI